MLGLLSMVFVVHGWRITPVPVNTPTSSDSGREIIDTRSLDLPSATLQAISGLPWSASEVEHRLAQARLKGHPHDQGWRVDAPPWRPDLLTEVDLVEDLVMARGVRGEDGILPASRTRGRRLGESWFRQRFVEMMLGVGFTQLYTQVLVSRRWVDRTGANQAVRIANPPSEQFSMMRDSLLLSLLAVLERNLRSGYPQRFHEVGPVLLRSAKAETGAETRYHAGFLIAAERAGFADAASLIDYLLGGFGVRGVREPTELLGTIPGRAARLRLTGESVAVIGEIHPEILNEARVPVPVAWGEVDLTALWPLVRRRK
jgi:phenylalanyl-tRNA synthetase beta chain